MGLTRRTARGRHHARFPTRNPPLPAHAVRSVRGAQDDDSRTPTSHPAPHRSCRDRQLEHVTRPACYGSRGDYGPGCSEQSRPSNNLQTFAVAPVSSSSPGAAPRTGPERAPILDQRRVNLTRGGEGFRCRESGRRPGPFAGQGAGQGFVDADVGGGVYKSRGGCLQTPLPYPLVLLGLLELDRTARAASAGRDWTGATPPF